MAQNLFRYGAPALLLGAMLGFVLQQFTHSHSLKSALGSPCASDYSYINPEPDCELQELKAGQLERLQLRLEEAVARFERTHEATRIGIFARDLLTRRFVGVNENGVFYMASLFKVPLMIAHFKVAEVNPDFLQNRIRYDGSINLYNMQAVQPPERLLPGNEYTTEELIRRAIVYSDNTAAELLIRANMRSDFLEQILAALNLSYTLPDGRSEMFITPKTYANIFRILYNSSYLTREYSDKALSILARSEYNDAAVAKLPKDLVIAHKFGERNTQIQGHPEQTSYQLHDCGTVYAKEKREPYTFCIMTEGKDFNEMKAIIQDLSLMLYEGMTGEENT